jgi:hypothetical protein
MLNRKKPRRGNRRNPALAENAYPDFNLDLLPAQSKCFDGDLRQNRVCPGADVCCRELNQRRSIRSGVPFNSSE